jgi:DNA-binding response OmpR family regulator
MECPDLKETILMIEDELGFRRIYSSVFKNAGYEVLEAEDGEKGLQMVIEHQPNVVLLDLMLPKMNGFDVLKEMRESELVKHIPVIIFSVIGEESLIEKGLSLGATDYTIKGFYTAQQILSKIQAVLLNKKNNHDLNSFFLFVEYGRGDSRELQKAFSLPALLDCPLCKKPLVLAMEADPNHLPEDGHWFTSHFYCRFCNKNF